MCKALCMGEMVPLPKNNLIGQIHIKMTIVNGKMCKVQLESYK